jgi:asparagine synthase (glutamine-hydrolysing)
MRDANNTVYSGSPVFADSGLAAEVQRGEVALAWRTALRQPIKDALRSVTGDFAIGITLDDGRTILAVDRFAVRSLCYRVCDGQIRFAMRADALADAEPQIDAQAIFDYLYFHFIPSPRTIFKDIFRLPPGHFAEFANGRLTVAPYWTPIFTEPRNVQFGEYQSEFLRLLKRGVQVQIDPAKPACFLSGGTDSSTVAGMAASLSDVPVATYSIGFEAEGYDEMAYARLAASHFKTQHHEYYVTPDDLVRSIPTIAKQFDQPFGNSSALPAYYCAKMARDDGVVKLLAGDGGDELFGGNTRYAKQRVFGWYDRIPGALRRSLLEPLSGAPLAARIPLVQKAASYVNQAKVPMPDRIMAYNLLFRLGVADVFSPALLARVDTHDPARQQRAVWAQTGNVSLVNRMLAFDWRYTLAECDLPKVIGATELAGVGVGFPLLDDQLVDFSMSLPTSYKLKGFQLRWFFKEALRGFLPDEIISKKKQGFGLPFGVWANKHAALKALASESLNNLASRGVVRAEFVHRLMNQRLPEHPGYYGEMVWILMMLEQWFAAKAPNFRL